MRTGTQSEAARPLPPAAADDGYMLLGLIVAIAILLLWLGVAAANIAFSIRRDREAETARRADQYVRAIRLYYKKFGHYPGSIEQLEKTNNIRFLRRRWIDPLTGADDWRVIEVGKNKTTPRGFFGAPLAGLPTSGLGALAGSLSPGMPGSPTAGGASGAPAAGTPGAAPSGTPGFGSSGANPASTSFGTGSTPAAPVSATPDGGTSPPGTPGAPGTAGATTPATSNAPGTSNPSSPSGTGGTNPTGAFMGIGVSATGNSILEVNEQTTYQTWEFLYDPRVEQLRVAQQLNSGAQTNSAGSLGQAPTTGAPDTNGSGGLPAQPNSGSPAPPASNAPGSPFIGAPIRP